MSDSPSEPTGSPAPASSTPVGSSRDVTPAADNVSRSRVGDADSAASAGRSIAEAPSRVAEATIEPPPIPGPRPEISYTAPVLAEAAIPVAPLPQNTEPAAASSASSGSESSAAFDHAAEPGTLSTIGNDQRPTGATVAEATYTPPPVHNRAAPDADQSISRDEYRTPSADSTTDAVLNADAQTHNDASGVTDALRGSEPSADITDPARTGDNTATGLASPPESREDSTPGPLSAEGTAPAPDRDLPEPAPRGEQAHTLDPAGTTADSDLAPPASSASDTVLGDSATTSTAADQRTGAPESQDSSDTDAVERYRAEDLGAFVAYGTATNHALYEGPDGRWHAVGDEVGQGLHREGTGRLRDAKGYVTDDNKLPPKGIDAHAERGQPLDRLPAPTSPDQLADLEALRAAALDRAEKLATKNEIWANQVEPLIDSLEQAGLTVDRNTFASANFRDEFDEAVSDLPHNLWAAADFAADDYALASRGLVEASETLGVAGGKFVASLLYPDGRTLTSSDGTRGVKETLDRTIYDGSRTPMLIIIEEKGAGSTLGVSKVDDPNNLGPKIIAQQCSPEYVHHLLKNDATLAAALQSDPQLYRNVQNAIQGSNGGVVQCLLVHTSAEGAVNVVPYLLDPSRFRREKIRISPDEGSL